MSVQNILGQDKETGAVSGQIVDAVTKETLIGATVMIVGTYNGVSADIDGNFN